MNINIDIKSGFLFNLVFSSGLTLSRAGVLQRERERERERGRENTVHRNYLRSAVSGTTTVTGKCCSLTKSQLGASCSLSNGVSLSTLLSHMHANRIVVEYTDGA